MEFSFGGSLMRCLLFIFNFVFWLTGLIMMAVGIWIRVDPDVTHFLNIVHDGHDTNPIHAAAVMIILVGAFICMVGFLGCCGACQAASWMLCGYIVLVSIILLLEIIAAALCIAYRSHLGKELQVSMKKQVMYDVDDVVDDGATLTWYLMQAKLKCCGSDSYKDYQGSNYTALTNLPVPPTCCVLNKLGFPDEQPEVRNMDKCMLEAEQENLEQGDLDLYTDGCYEKLVSWIKSKSGVIIGVGIGIALIQVLGIVFACRVRMEIKDRQKL